MGIPIPIFLSIYALGKFWAFFSHSRLLGTWGIFEYFLITPSLHAVHHSCNGDNLNKNFGEMLVIWDMLFGTFKKNHKDLVYGIGKKIDDDNFIYVVTHELEDMISDVRTAVTIREKLGCIFGRPRG